MPVAREAGSGSRASPSPIALADASLEAALEWFTALQSGDASPQEYEQWKAWLNASQDHQAAWEKVQSVFGRLRTLDADRAYRTLTPYAVLAPKGVNTGRRRAIVKGLAITGLALGVGGIATRSQIALAISADYRTGKGETRLVRLGDGLSLSLDTETAVSTHMHDGAGRIELLEGQVCVRLTGTHASGGARSQLTIRTEHGVVRTGNAEFIVRVHRNHTSCIVLRDRVEVSSVHEPQSSAVIQAGQQVDFTDDLVGPVSVAGEAQAAWLNGQIMVDNVTLSEFVREVSRYRTGVIRVSPEVADLRISGAFPTTDTDRILASLPRALPVRIRQLTRYWTTIDAQSPPRASR